MKACLFVFATLLFCNFAFAGLCHFPQSSFQVQSVEAKAGISRADFDAAIDLVEKTWGPVAQAEGYNLVFRRLWSDRTANSDTDVEGRSWVVNSYGGLARFPGMTKDGYVLVACHELGHHLGGAPLYTDETWASVEGSADYFATLQCAKNTIKDTERIKAASKVLAKVLAALGGEKVPSTDTPDKTKVAETFESHPAAQCRLDTYIAGLKCKVPYAPMSKTDARVASCFSYENDTAAVGSRPRCWFKP